MHELTTLWPFALAAFLGLFVFRMAWAQTPISGLIAFLGFLSAGLRASNWLSSTPITSHDILPVTFTVLLTAIFTYRSLVNR